MAKPIRIIVRGPDGRFASHKFRNARRRIEVFRGNRRVKILRLQKRRGIPKTIQKLLAKPPPRPTKKFPVPPGKTFLQRKNSKRKEISFAIVITKVSTSASNNRKHNIGIRIPFDPPVGFAKAQNQALELRRSVADRLRAEFQAKIISQTVIFEN